MAQKGMRPEVKAAKLRNNKVGLLTCSTSGCDNEFYIAIPTYPSVRKCPTHWAEPTGGAKPTFADLLGLLGL